MNRYSRLRIFCALVFFCVLLGCLIGCGSKDEVQAAGKPVGADARPAPPVVVAAAEQRDIPNQLSEIGNVEAYQMVQIRSQVNGQIENIFFKEGEDVRQGQKLFQLDKRPFQADLDKAIGALQHDEAQAENSKAQADRYTSLEKQGVISREQADTVRTQAKADASAVNADKAAVEAARVQLRYTDIIAPIEARTGALLINKGNLVKANDTPFLVQLNQLSPIYVTFSIPEANLEEVRRLSGGRLKVMAYPKGQTANPAEGNLTFIDNGVNPQTGTVKLKATFANKDRRLWPGEYVDVVMNLSVHKNAILVPTKAVQNGQQGDYVYVVNSQDVAEARQVKIAGAFKDFTLIANGVNARERVVVSGQLRVAPNAKVVVQSTLPAGNAGDSNASTGGTQ